tara:strand:+ start:639 stop:878 length:240 start_codon:yes stop_codon:yes gene_type:complete
MNKWFGWLLQIHLFDKLIAMYIFKIFKIGIDYRGSEMGPYIAFIFGVLNTECQIMFAWKSINERKHLENDILKAKNEMN